MPRPLTLKNLVQEVVADPRFSEPGLFDGWQRSQLSRLAKQSAPNIRSALFVDAELHAALQRYLEALAGALADRYRVYSDLINGIHPLQQPGIRAVSVASPHATAVRYQEPPAYQAPRNWEEAAAQAAARRPPPGAFSLTVKLEEEVETGEYEGDGAIPPNWEDAEALLVGPTGPLIISEHHLANEPLYAELREILRANPEAQVARRLEIYEELESRAEHPEETRHYQVLRFFCLIQLGRWQEAQELGQAHLEVPATAEQLKTLVTTTHSREGYLLLPRSINYRVGFSPHNIVENIPIVGFTLAEITAWSHLVVHIDGQEAISHSLIFFGYRMDSALKGRAVFTPLEQDFWQACIERMSQEIEIFFAVLTHFIRKHSDAESGTAHHKIVRSYQKSLQLHQERWSCPIGEWYGFRRPGTPSRKSGVSSSRPDRGGFVALPFLPVLAAIGLGMQLAGGNPKPLALPHQHPVSAHHTGVHKPNLHQSLSHHLHRSPSSIHPDLALPITGIGVNSLADVAFVENFSLIVP